MGREGPELIFLIYSLSFWKQYIQYKDIFWLNRLQL